MYKYLTKLISDFKNRQKLQYVCKTLKSFNFYIENVSFEDKTVIFSKDDKLMLFNLNDGFLGHRLEATVTIKSEDLVSLKTLSDLSNIAYIHTCYMSGLKHGHEGIRIPLGLAVPKQLRKNDIKMSVLYLEECIKTMDSYIFGRYSNFNDNNLDLSMFEETDLFLFDPQLLGEKKQFIYESWLAYLERAAEADFSSFSETISDIKACMVFEKTNKMLLSEVGDMVLRELVWNRRMSESSADENTVN
jgi:hypothetical protein